MAKFTWYGPHEYWHPVCTTELLFDNKDSDTERIACLQNQCVTAEAVIANITPCRTALLPIGSTTSKYLWGVDGSPFNITPNLSTFPTSSNEFGAPGYTLQPREAVAPEEHLYSIIILSNGSWSVIINPRAWSDGNWIPTERMIVGYRALNGAGIESLSINPSEAIGSRIWEPISTLNLGCSVSANAIDRPTIEYYDVGSNGDERPADMDVTFNNVEIKLLSMPSQVSLPTLQPNGLLPDRFYQASNYTYAINGVWSITWDSETDPAVDEDYMKELWSLHEPRKVRSTIGGLESIRDARVEVPATQVNLNVNPPQMIRRYETGPIFHTGFRMQKHLQANYYAWWTQSGTSYVTCGVRHLETRLYRTGYFATWEYVSSQPQDYITIITSNSLGYNVQNIARGSVTVRVRYHDLKDRVSDINKYEYGPDRDDGPESTYPLITPAFQKYNPPFKQWIWERTAIRNQYGQWSPVIPGDWAGDHAVGGPQTVSIASVGPMPFGIVNPLSPRHPTAKAYYKWRMTPTVHTTSTFGIFPAYFFNAVPSHIQYTRPSSSIGNTQSDAGFTPNPAQVSFSVTIPNDYAFWRRRQ